MNTTLHFRHPSNHFRSWPVCVLRGEYGAAGYGRYMVLLELLTQHDNRIDTTDEVVVVWLCTEMQLEPGTLRELLSVCEHAQLIEQSVGIISSPLLVKNIHGKARTAIVRLWNSNVKLWYKLRKIVFERDGYTCVYCFQYGGKLEADHITPLSRGGSNDLSNLVTACRRCNRQKRDKTVREFIVWRYAR
jgi:hypothetical protein